MNFMIILYYNKFNELDVFYGDLWFLVVVGKKPALYPPEAEVRGSNPLGRATLSN